MLAWLSEILVFQGRMRRFLPGNKENIGKMTQGTKGQGFYFVVPFQKIFSVLFVTHKLP